MVIMMPHIKMGHAARTDFAMQMQGLSKSKETNMSIVARTLVMTVWATSSSQKVFKTPASQSGCLDCAKNIHTSS